MSRRSLEPGEVILGLIAFLLLCGALGCSEHRQGVTAIVLDPPLPAVLTRWVPVSVDDAGAPLEPCADCAPVLWQFPEGPVGLAGVELQTWTPPVAAGAGVYRPQAIQKPSANFGTRVTRGLAVGDSLVLPLSGINFIAVSAFAGFDPDTLERLEVLGGHAALVAVAADRLEGYAYLDVRLAAGVPWRLWAYPRLMRMEP